MKLRPIIISLLAAAIAVPSLADGGNKRLSPRAAIIAAQAAGKTLSCERAETTRVPAYLIIDPETIDREALALLGVELVVERGTIATAQLPVESIAALAQVRGIEYVQTASPARQQMDIARQETGSAAMNAGEGLPQPFTGKGVVVGIIDSGFEYTHEAFRASDGSLRIKRVWEQDENVELITEEQILSASGDIRNNTHGTHVTSIAAGSSPRENGTLRGMAPEADIVLVSMTDEGEANVNISNAIAYIFNYADEVGKPCVVNLSLGANSGPHDGTSPFDRLADQMQGPGRLIVGAAGNHLENNFHLHRDVTADNVNQSFATFIDYVSAPSATNTGGDIEVWTDCQEMTAAMVLYKLSNCNETERTAIDINAEEPMSITLGRRVTGSFTVVSEESPLNGKRHIFLHSDVTAIQSGYAIAIELTPASEGVVDIWADTYNVTLSSRGKEGFFGPSPDDATICEIGGTAKRIMTVGAYTTRADYYTMGNPAEQHLNETVGDLCSFSGHGPTADGRTKPQVTAPGAFIVSAMSQYGVLSSFVSHYFNDSGRSTYYGYMQGTSMAAPAVTGIVAAWLEAYPQLTPEELAEVIRTSSRTDNYTGNVGEEGSNSWGYGKIDAIAGLQRCIELANESGIDSPQANDQKKAQGTAAGSLCGYYDLSGRFISSSPAELSRGIYIYKTMVNGMIKTKKYSVK